VIWVAGGEGFEPSYMASKATVLPLDDPPPFNFEPRKLDFKVSCTITAQLGIQVYCRRSGSNRHESCPPMVFETIASAYSATSARY
jgi:hypothetical protein